MSCPAQKLKLQLDASASAGEKSYRGYPNEKTIGAFSNN